jgi:hypothetical protein
MHTYKHCCTMCAVSMNKYNFPTDEFGKCYLCGKMTKFVIKIELETKTVNKKIHE